MSSRNDILGEIRVREMFLQDALELGFQNAALLLTESIQALRQGLEKLDKKRAA